MWAGNAEDATNVDPPARDLADNGAHPPTLSKGLDTSKLDNEDNITYPSKASPQWNISSSLIGYRYNEGTA